MNGIELIAAERRRQVEAEGWNAEHDDQHTNGSLIDAAVTYAIANHPQMPGPKAAMQAWWPWGPSGWKPSSDPVRNLVKAGALIAAEIDRLQRAA